MPETILEKRYDRLNPCGFAMLLILLAGMWGPVWAADAPRVFDALEKRLIEDGFDSARIKAVYASPDVSFEKGGVSAYFMHKEAKLNYKQFTVSGMSLRPKIT
jgi:hypothetical protein